MGQYFYIVNLDKKEFLHPHKLGMGLKLWEICANDGAGVIAYLLRQSSGRGSGDIHGNPTWAGHWAGDRLTVVGDYDESRLYDMAKKTYKDISLLVRPEYEEFLGRPLGERWDTH